VETIEDSAQFKLLTYKTFYALKSKFYLKNAEEKVRKHIQEMTEKIKAMTEGQVILMRFDNLPENYPLSFVYDLVDFVGGKWEDIEEADAVDDFSAELLVLKATALKLVK
jgi:hypothetical protein